MNNKIREMKPHMVDPDDVGEDADDIAMVCAFANKNGIKCHDFEDSCRTWLNGVTCINGAVTASGRRRGRAVFKMIALLLSGVRYKDAFEETGLNWRTLSEFKFVSRDLGVLLDAAGEEQKLQLGRQVLDAAFDRAINGFDRTLVSKGQIVGVEHTQDSRLMEKLLLLSGKEFRTKSEPPVQKTENVGVKMVWNIMGADGKPAMLGGAKVLPEKETVDV